MTVDETSLFFGGPASLTVGGTEIGATVTPPKITTQATIYAPDFVGAGGPIAGAAFVNKIKTTIEFTVNEITAAKLAISLPGSSTSVGTGTAASAGAAFSTTTTATTAIGDNLIPLTSVAAPLAVGQFLKIDTSTNAEFRTVRAIVGNVVELTENLTKAHASGVAVVRTVDLDVSTTTWRTGRVPTASFQTVILDGVGVDGRHLVATVTGALSDGNLSIEMSDTAISGSNVVMTGYYAGSDPTLCPVSIAVG